MSLNIVFAGTPDFALPALKALYSSSHKVVGIWTQPDKPKGRGKKLSQSPVKQFALEKNVLVFQPNSLKNQESLEAFQSLKPDVCVVAAYGMLLPKVWLETPKYGCINIHASILPRWRGAAPIAYALLNNDLYTGVSIMQMSEGLDTGDVYTSLYCETAGHTSASLTAQLSQMGAKAILQVVNRLTSTVKPVPQNNLFATKAPKIQKQDGLIDWQEDAGFIGAKVRAFFPWPCAFVGHGDNQIKNHSACVFTSDAGNINPGTIIAASAKGIDVACSHGVLRIVKAQLPGSKPMEVGAILNGHRQRFAPGHIFG